MPVRIAILILLLGMCGSPASHAQARFKFLIPSGYSGAELPATVDRRDLLDARHMARLGDVASQFNTGAMYHALGNIKAATYWYHRAALFRHPLASYNLGVMYYEGQQVPHDLEAAVRWISVSAEAGYPPAQTLMGLMAYRDQLVDASPADEAGWYQKAALGGDPIAQFNLGVLYTRGYGVEKDLARGYAWLLMGAPEVGEDAVLEEVAPMLTAAELAAARSLRDELEEEITPYLLAGR